MNKALRTFKFVNYFCHLRCVGSNCRQGKSGIVKLALQDLTVNVRILTTDADNSSATYFWKVEQSPIGENYAEITNPLIESEFYNGSVSVSRNNRRSGGVSGGCDGDNIRDRGRRCSSISGGFNSIRNSSRRN